MTTPSTEALTTLLRDFMAGLRAHFTKVAADADRDLMVDRVFAGAAALIGAVLSVLPLGKRRDETAEAFLAAAVRFWNRRNS
jgi:hypothetical protein